MRAIDEPPPAWLRLLAIVCALPLYLAIGLPWAALQTWRARRRLRQHGAPAMLTRGAA